MTRSKLAGVIGFGLLGALAASAMAMAHTSGDPVPAPAAQAVGAIGATSHGAMGATKATATTQGMGAMSMGTTQGKGSTQSMGATQRHHVTVVLRNVNGMRTAQVEITGLRDGGNRVTIHAWGLTPGFHAIHIHAIGVCDPAGAKPFASAGGHLNPAGAPEGMQAGAFPVLLAGADGQARVQFVDGNFSFRDLLGPTGSAIVIHALPDNYANIPNRYTANGMAGPDIETQMTGDAGTRVACGVIASPQAMAMTSGKS